MAPEPSPPSPASAIHLREALQRLGRGERGVRVDVADAAGDAELAAAFNAVAQALEGRETGPRDGEAAARAEHASVAEQLLELRKAVVAHQEELLVSQRRLAQSQRFAALGALVAKIAHEVGTPLHSVAGHLQLLLGDSALPAAVQERLRIVAGEVERLAGMIRQHLTQLRSPAPVIAPASVNALLRRTVELLEPVLEARGVRCLLDLDAAAEAPIGCDAHQVEQVVLNLVQNALDAMPQGGRLTLRTTATPHALGLSVCDTGVGIPPESQGRVFEPFYTTKGPGRGSGLGLSLCREIARGHGGDVLLDSRPGEGTVVTLTLRRRVVEVST